MARAYEEFIRHDTEQNAKSKVGSAGNVKKIKELLNVGKRQQNRGEYAEAWESFEQAAKLNEDDAEIRTAQEDLGMEWLGISESTRVKLLLKSSPGSRRPSIVVC